MYLYVTASIVLYKMGESKKSPSQTAINKLIHHGWRTPTVTLKTTEKRICTPASPVVLQSSYCKCHIQVRGVFWRRMLTIDDTIS
jgi:hypothetical protein